MRTRTIYERYHPPVQSEARHREEVQRERDSRRGGLSEQMDRTHLDGDMAMGILNEIERQHPRGFGGMALERFPTLRPRFGTVFARRRPEFADVKAAGLVIPDLCDRPRGQQATSLYDVLAIGPGVSSVRVGDVIVASSYVGVDLGAVLGEDVYALRADVTYVDEREYETERVKHEDGSHSLHSRRMSDVERRSGGDILGVVEE